MWLSFLFTILPWKIQTKGQWPNCSSIEVFINVRLWFKLIRLDNCANRDNIFKALLLSDETYKSKFRLLTIFTPSNFYFLLSQIFVCLILAQIFSCLCLESRRWHSFWFSFAWLFSEYSIAKRLSYSNLLIRKLRSLSHAEEVASSAKFHTAARSGR